MESSKRLSVIVPVYNVEQYLERCVDSILNQTVKELEIILVDDGSTDNSGSMCDAYAAEHANIRVHHKSNGGLTTAWKAGLELATPVGTWASWTATTGLTRICMSGC